MQGEQINIKIYKEIQAMFYDKKEIKELKDKVRLFTLEIIHAQISAETPLFHN